MSEPLLPQRPDPNVTPPSAFEDLLKDRFPHTAIFFARFFDGKLTTKQQLQSATSEYIGLTFMEKCSATRMLSSSAHIADPIKDNRACRILTEILQSMHANLGITPPHLRLIIANSDSPQAAAGRFPSSKEASLILSSKLIELLDDRQLKAILAHELGHIERDLLPNMFSQFFMQPLKHLVTRNATRRKMEYKADEFSIRTTRDPEAWESAMAAVNSYLAERTAGLRKAVEDSLPSEKVSRGIKIFRWFFDIALNKMMDTINDSQDTKPFTTWEALLKAPRYPSTTDRIRNVRDIAAKEGFDRPPSAER